MLTIVYYRQINSQLSLKLEDSKHIISIKMDIFKVDYNFIMFNKVF